jgi:NAD(P)-dependent dehydrogenase (short-subunit alcohol dehydrogenase family)
MAGPWPVPDLTGRTIVVTGANSGIGKATARQLASAGAHVVMAARDRSRGTAARDQLRRATGNEAVDLVVFDLSDRASVRDGAAGILELAPRLHGLVNNAGLVLSDRRLSADGVEMTLAVNHLGPFLLTALLADRLLASAPSRVVTVSSISHRQPVRGLDFDDLGTEHRYRALKAYGRSKLANVLFTRELARRTAGTGLTANCCHPGVVATGYSGDGDTSGWLAWGFAEITPILLTPDQGARTPVYLVSAPELAAVSGQYFVGRRVRRPSRAARDPDAARRLWEVSRLATGLTTAELPPDRWPQGAATGRAVGTAGDGRRGDGKRGGGRRGDGDDTIFPVRP